MAGAGIEGGVIGGVIGVHNAFTKFKNGVSSMLLASCQCGVTSFVKLAHSPIFWPKLRHSIVMSHFYIACSVMALFIDKSPAERCV